MDIIVNGEVQMVADRMNVAELLAQLHVPADKIAVEHNLEIVPKSLFAATQLKAGDRIEIVQFIGGGA